MAGQMDVTFKGYVGAAPTLHTTRHGTVIAVLRVAHSMNRRLPNGEYDSDAQWFDVKCFGRLAENVASCVSTGYPLLIRGRIVTESWENPAGQMRSKVIVIASAIGVELNFGTASYQRSAQVVPTSESGAVAPEQEQPTTAPNRPRDEHDNTRAPKIGSAQKSDQLARSRLAQYTAQT
ncbi:MAG: single-stranded DNA-binding protein [Bowdeniella nasicola]|nr:single-stranded DNA-binding protein [Bowdeniella nasicola]